jgi:hypothetical protein
VVLLKGSRGARLEVLAARLVPDRLVSQPGTAA